jgi:hypothetical protein
MVVLRVKGEHDKKCAVAHVKEACQGTPPTPSSAWRLCCAPVLDACITAPDFSTALRTADAPSLPPQSEFEADLFETLTAINASFNSADNPRLNRFFGKYLPNYRVPGSKIIAGRLLDQAFERATSSWSAEDGLKGSFVSGQSDGLKNRNKQALMGHTIAVHNKVCAISSRTQGSDITTYLDPLPGPTGHDRSIENCGRDAQAHPAANRVFGACSWHGPCLLGHRRRRRDEEGSQASRAPSSRHSGSRMLGTSSTSHRTRQRSCF